MNPEQKKTLKQRQAIVSKMKEAAQPAILKSSLRATLASMDKKKKIGVYGLI